MLLTDQQPHQPLRLPEPEELLCSDDTPVDNEDQNLLPNLLLTTLLRLWADRQDWFLGVDMGIFHTSGDNPNVPVVPDAFLSLGVDRRKGGNSRRSYVVWKEDGVVPSFVLAMVSYTARGEYQEKLEIYRQLGVLYCAVYNPEFYKRDNHDPFEVYRLEKGQYVRQAGEPVWMPQLGLGLGRYRYDCWGIEQELLVWFDADGNVHGIPEVTREELLRAQRRTERERQSADELDGALDTDRQRAEQEKLRADSTQQALEAEQQQTQRLNDYLRSLGVDPDNLPPSGDVN
ncbi:MAG: Uma2 family endonuclease [Prochlorothrix sp.]